MWNVQCSKLNVQCAMLYAQCSMLNVQCSMLNAHGLKKVTTSNIKVGDHTINASKSVKNIGAYLDSRLSMETQVKYMRKSAWLHLYNIGKIRHYLSNDRLKIAIHAYVTPKLDLNNALLTGISQQLLRKLQSVQEWVRVRVRVSV